MLDWHCPDMIWARNVLGWLFKYCTCMFFMSFSQHRTVLCMQGARETRRWKRKQSYNCKSCMNSKDAISFDDKRSSSDCTALSKKNSFRKTREPVTLNNENVLAKRNAQLSRFCFEQSMNPSIIAHRRSILAPLAQRSRTATQRVYGWRIDRVQQECQEADLILCLPSPFCTLGHFV